MPVRKFRPNLSASRDKKSTSGQTKPPSLPSTSITKPSNTCHLPVQGFRKQSSSSEDGGDVISQPLNSPTVKDHCKTLDKPVEVPMNLPDTCSSSNRIDPHSQTSTSQHQSEGTTNLQTKTDEVLTTSDPPLETDNTKFGIHHKGGTVIPKRTGKMVRKKIAPRVLLGGRRNKQSDEVEDKNGGIKEGLDQQRTEELESVGDKNEGIPRTSAVPKNVSLPSDESICDKSSDPSSILQDPVSTISSEPHGTDDDTSHIESNITNYGSEIIKTPSKQIGQQPIVFESPPIISHVLEIPTAGSDLRCEDIHDSIDGTTDNDIHEQRDHLNSVNHNQPSPKQLSCHGNDNSRGNDGIIQQLSENNEGGIEVMSTPVPTDDGDGCDKECTRVNTSKRKRNSSSSTDEHTIITKRKKSSPQDNGRGKSNQFREAPDRATMTMQDLIYYNPSSNPMSSTERHKSVTQKSSSSNSTPDNSSVSNHSLTPPQERSIGTEEEKDDEQIGEDNDRIVPLLKIGADGNIVIDETSMIVETSQKQISEMQDDILEESEYTMSTSFRQKHKIKKWSKEETAEFYKALSQVGTDFTMMTLLLPKRSRKELKNKFKKEEKFDSLRISAALSKLCKISRKTVSVTSNEI